MSIAEYAYIVFIELWQSAIASLVHSMFPAKAFEGS